MDPNACTTSFQLQERRDVFSVAFFLGSGDLSSSGAKGDEPDGFDGFVRLCQTVMQGVTLRRLDLGVFLWVKYSSLKMIVSGICRVLVACDLQCCHIVTQSTLGLLGCFWINNQQR